MSREVVLTEVDNQAVTAQCFFQLIDNNRTYLRQWLPWLDTVRQVSDTQNFLDQTVYSDSNNQSLNFFIYVNDELAGTIGVREIGQNNDIGVSAIVGYWVAEHTAGQGVATAALHQLIKKCGTESKGLGIDTLVLRCNPNNIASKKVALKCGFSYRGLLRGACNLYGRISDLEVYHLALRC